MAGMNSLDAEIASWGRDLDSLQNRKLHPSLINAKVLKKAFQKITEKARKVGMRLLHQELSSIYKCPVSYISTTDHIILATDFEGRRGLEMSELDLLRCNTENLSVGKLYVCPNTNLIRNNICNSCLGSMFFGHTEKMLEKCHVFPSLPKEEFAEQISEDSVTNLTL